MTDTQRVQAAGAGAKPRAGSIAERTAVVVPSYFAATTLESVCDDLPREAIDDLIIVDDCSGDRTAEIGRSHADCFIRHPKRRGYGGAQKTGYRAALERGATIVIMVHGDYQYDPRLTPLAKQTISMGLCDVVLGNRIRTRREALAGGMPIAKYLANRSLTQIENILAGQNLGEWHSGFRAYSRSVLETVPFERNSDGFVFDSQMLVQCVHFGFSVGDIPTPVRYFGDASSIGLGPAAAYSLRTLGVFARWYLHRLRLKRCPLFQARETGAP